MCFGCNEACSSLVFVLKSQGGIGKEFFRTAMFCHLAVLIVGKIYHPLHSLRDCKPFSLVTTLMQGLLEFPVLAFLGGILIGILG